MQRRLDAAQARCSAGSMQRWLEGGPDQIRRARPQTANEGPVGPSFVTYLRVAYLLAAHFSFLSAWRPSYGQSSYEPELALQLSYEPEPAWLWSYAQWSYGP